MNANIHTSEEYRDVFTWLKGGDATPDPIMEGRFIEMMTTLVRQNLENKGEIPQEPQPAPVQRERRRIPSTLSLRSLMEEAGLEYDPSVFQHNYQSDAASKPVVEEKTQVPTETESPYTEKGLDSITVAKALSYIGVMKDKSINMSQIQSILYIVYGVWLAQKGERLYSEHPQMWQFGPVFPRAYNKLKKEPSNGEAEYNTLKEKEPKLLGYLEDCFSRYAWTSASNLNVAHVGQGSPWAATRRKNPDKWGAAIEDSLIEKWFSQRIK